MLFIEYHERSRYTDSAKDRHYEGVATVETEPRTAPHGGRWRNLEWSEYPSQVEYLGGLELGSREVDPSFVRQVAGAVAGPASADLAIAMAALALAFVVVPLIAEVNDSRAVAFLANLRGPFLALALGALWHVQAVDPRGLLPTFVRHGVHIEHLGDVHGVRPLRDLRHARHNHENEAVGGV